MIKLIPYNTEKTSLKNKDNIYVFKVPISLNKVEIKKMIKSLYNVAPISVNTVVMPKKDKFTKYGKTIKRNEFKKAYVKFDKSIKIDINKIN